MDKEEKLKKAIQSVMDAHSENQNGDLDAVSLSDAELGDGFMDTWLNVTGSSKFRKALSDFGYIVNHKKGNDSFSVDYIGVETVIAKEEEVEEESTKMSLVHTYVKPQFFDDIIDVLRDEVPHNIWTHGPTGCGKTHCVKEVAIAMGRPMYRFNCQKFMSPSSLVGEKTIEIDEKSGQNHIVYQDGMLIRAMQEGLDKDGKEVGEPAIMYIDEAGSMPASVSIMLNRVLEGMEKCMEVVVDGDGGRLIKAHSGFRIVFSANTIGRGLTSLSDVGYSAQTDAQDISLLNRITTAFKFGYSKKAERSILHEKIGSSVDVKKLEKLRDAVRDAIREQAFNSPFSTRDLVKICNMYRVMGDLEKALYYSVITFLPEEDVATINELWRAEHATDLMNKFSDDDMDYV